MTLLTSGVLAGSGVHLTRREIAPSRFAHNKFAVFCDATGAPKTVWTGSTNWTHNGLCTQNNNGLEMEDETVARSFRDHWLMLQADGSTSPPTLTADNDVTRSFDVDGSRIDVWFTPTSDRRDLTAVRSLINDAKQGIVFLMLNPGPDGLLGPIIERGSPHDGHFDPNLHIRGVVHNFPSRSKETPADSLSLLTSDGARQNFSSADLGEVLKPARIDDTAATEVAKQSGKTPDEKTSLVEAAGEIANLRASTSSDVAPIGDVAWLWGHEHNLCIYEPGYLGLARGRCLGNGAVPVLLKDAPYHKLTKIRGLPDIIDGTMLSVDGNTYAIGFAIITLSASPEATSADYCQNVNEKAELVWHEILSRMSSTAMRFDYDLNIAVGASRRWYRRPAASDFLSCSVTPDEVEPERRPFRSFRWQHRRPDPRP